MRDIVTKHYQGEGGLGDRFEAQLNSLGFDKRRLSAQDTAPLDQFRFRLERKKRATNCDDQHHISR